jgi:hypothetical protein
MSIWSKLNNSEFMAELLYCISRGTGWRGGAPRAWDSLGTVFSLKLLGASQNISSSLSQDSLEIANDIKSVPMLRENRKSLHSLHVGP